MKGLIGSVVFFLTLCALMVGSFMLEPDLRYKFGMSTEMIYSIRAVIGILGLVVALKFALKITLIVIGAAVLVVGITWLMKTYM